MRRAQAVRARRGLPPSRAAGSPGFAAVLSALLPGVGQTYQGRWVRGILMVLLPVFALLLAGTFIAIADPLTSLVLRNAPTFTFLVVGSLLVYHLFVVADAFAGKLRGLGALRGRHAVELLVLALVCAALVGFYGTLYRGSAAWASLAAKVFEPIARQPLIANAQEPLVAWSGTERLNVLLLGVDARGDGSPNDNTDTMIVLSLDPVNKTASMLSVPRDIWINRPGVFVDKINGAYAFGGPDLTKRVVEDLLGIRLHAYALVDFEAFTRIVDSVGGVVIDVKRPLRDESYPTADYGVERIEILSGPQLMNGTTALQYARSRHDTNDYSRSRRQQEVLTALRSRLAQGDLLRQLPGIVDRVGSFVKTNFDPANLLPLARFGSGIDGSSIRSEVLYPCGGVYPHCELRYTGDENGFFLVPELAKVREFAAELFYDPQVKAEAASVELRTAGVARAVGQSLAERLGARAFSVTTISSGQSARSGVFVRTGAKRYTANELARQLGGLPVDTLPAGEQTTADILVRVGSDFRGLATDTAR